MIERKKSDIVRHVNREFFSEDEVIEAYKRLLNGHYDY